MGFVYLVTMGPVAVLIMLLVPDALNLMHDSAKNMRKRVTLLLGELWIKPNIH